MSTALTMESIFGPYYVAQRESNDCGVACLAMLTSLSYEPVRRDFPDMVSQGLSEVQIVEWLQHWGFWTKRWWTSRPPAMPAPDGIILVDDGHWIVRRGGTLLDPARKPAKALHEYSILKWIELCPAGGLKPRSPNRETK